MISAAKKFSDCWIRKRSVVVEKIHQHLSSFSKYRFSTWLDYFVTTHTEIIAHQVEYKILPDSFLFSFSKFLVGQTSVASLNCCSPKFFLVSFLQLFRLSLCSRCATRARW